MTPRSNWFVGSCGVLIGAVVAQLWLLPDAEPASVSPSRNAGVSTVADASDMSSIRQATSDGRTHRTPDPPLPVSSSPESPVLDVQTTPAVEQWRVISQGGERHGLASTIPYTRTTVLPAGSRATNHDKSIAIRQAARERWARITDRAGAAPWKEKCFAGIAILLPEYPQTYVGREQSVLASPEASAAWFVASGAPTDERRSVVIAALREIEVDRQRVLAQIWDRVLELADSGHFAVNSIAATADSGVIRYAVPGALPAADAALENFMRCTETLGPDCIRLIQEGR